MIVVLIIGILMAIAVPNFIQARATSRKNSCVANLKQVDSGKEQYAMEAKLDTPKEFSVRFGDNERNHFGMSNSTFHACTDNR